MNIVTPILTAIAHPTANVNTESARRDNVLRETIPQSGDAEKGASQKGLGSDTDKARNPGQTPAPVTYDRPQIQTELQSAFESVFGEQKDNGSDESAGKQNARDQQESNQQASGEQALQPEQQTEEEQQEISNLEARDQEVRTHEQAHAAAGGQYAGSPQYEYTTGPDNKRYVTDGEVSIDISELNSPEETLQKMQQVRAAALAPAEPSAQDLKVAAEATQKSFEARSEIAEDNAATSSVAPNASEITPPDIDEITDNAGVERPTRALDEAVLQAQTDEQSAGSQGLQSAASQGIQSAASETSNEIGGGFDTRSLAFGNEAQESQANSARIGRIQNFYTQAYTPVREGFSASA
ncbi:putative metalloprotease CJM1_0395 family protein [Alteromonas sp. CI.11.F.A3]|uniref:putative metalloprotease CJM1_0395 family protein n=1 Tax=Alteromonas sp. CI.11.F.A3 TaxID=3079555 RepID=UPI00294223FC|nr:putative metalloprotease CJM1_0395 family protein [Alteromonas sp. CI.11.F.A3]WOI37662.1 putative metalloprotease CJM1_0395 family protein [Alteromonas sp. CI.11.F.A3]